MEPQVLDNKEKHRFELMLDGKLVGFSDYELRLDQMSLVHVEVNPELQGSGLAAKLMQGTIDLIRAEGNKKIVPVCSYAVMWMKRNTDTHDLLAIDIDEAVAACRINRRFN